MKQQDPSPSCKVKNTFLEFEEPQAGETRGRRARSDVTKPTEHNTATSPLVVASKSPTASPGLHPVDETMQAVPIDEVDFELLEEAAPADGTFGGPTHESSTPGFAAQHGPGLGSGEPAYVVPTTPSPFLHSAFPPTVVPPFGYGAGGMGYGLGPAMGEMGLPPAYGEGGQDGEGGYMDADGQHYMQGMQFMPEMYDPSCAPYMPFWPGMPMDGSGGFGEGAIGPDGQPMMSFPMGGVNPDGTPIDGTLPDGFGQGGADQAGMGGMAEGQTEGGRKEGRRGKGRKKEAQAEEKAGGGGAGRDRDSGNGGGKAPPPVKAGDLSAATAANQAAMDAAEEYTTVMLRNIPNKYTREMLIKQLSVDFEGMFDFMYLPIDFKNKCNVGYGFINFRTQDACEYFVKSFHGVDVRKCLPGLNSKKIVEVTPARVQGLVENVRRLRNSPVMNQLQDHPEWMPLLFNEHGDEEPFPSPDQPLPPVKPRGRAREVPP